MKKFLVLIMIIGISALSLTADVYIKQALHTDGYYYGGVNSPEENGVNEVWIGKKKLASLTENRLVIVDAEKKMAFVVNRGAKTYVESPLPLDLSKIVEDNLVPMIQPYRYKGTVKETGKTKKIGSRECREYEINTYVIYQGDRVNETDTTVWASTDVPFDLDIYESLTATQHMLRNFGDSLIEELKKIKGITIAANGLFYPKGFGVKSTVKVLEMAEKEAPAGIYSVPEGYTKKEKLSLQDLRNR